MATTSLPIGTVNEIRSATGRVVGYTELVKKSMWKGEVVLHWVATDVDGQRVGLAWHSNVEAADALRAL